MGSLKRIRPSNLVILVAAPFLVYLFTASSNYRRSLLLSGGDYAIFLEDRLAIAFFVLAIAITAGSLVGEWRRANALRKETRA